MHTPMPVIIQPISPADAQVQLLISKLDHFQIELYGRENCHLDSIETLLKSGAHMLGAFSGEQLVGMGAVKIMSGYAEIKRMYVEESHRGLGIAENILSRLEAYTIEQGENRICLETGIYHKAAMSLYKKMGYKVIDQFGEYKINGLSVFFEKWA